METQFSPHRFDPNDKTIRIPSYTKPLFDQYIRDTYVTRGPEGWHYLTGTTPAPGRPGVWDWNDGIRLWRSKDLISWEPMGLIYDLDRDGTWQKPFEDHKGGLHSFTGEKMDSKTRVVWAPEIHYIRSRKTWMIAACRGNMKDPRRGNFILRSKTGLLEGPYENILACQEGPLDDHIDASLFEDDDGSVYYVCHNHYIARLKDDLSGLAEPLRELKETPFPKEFYCEGAFIVKHGGKYHLIQSFWSRKHSSGQIEYSPPENGKLMDETSFGYDSVIASSDHIYGPYGPRYPSVIGGGHNNVFEDSQGRWWSTAFAPPRGADKEIHSYNGTCYACRPLLIPMSWEKGRLLVDCNRKNIWS
jgi:hypothetical protein